MAEGYFSSLLAQLTWVVVVTVIAWGWARYKKVSLFWQWAAFSIMELIIGLTAAAAVARFGLPAVPCGIVALLIPIAVVRFLDARVAIKKLPDSKSLPTSQAKEDPETTARQSPSDDPSSYVALRAKVKATPLPFRQQVAAGFIGTRVEWVGTLSSLDLREDGRYRFQLHVKMQGTVVGTTFFASIEDRPQIAILNEGDRLKITGNIARVFDDGIVHLDPAEYERL